MTGKPLCLSCAQDIEGARSVAVHRGEKARPCHRCRRLTLWVW